MKIAVAQIKSIPGRIEENKRRILSAIEDCKNDMPDLILFPELALLAYNHLDICWNEELLEDQEEALQEILARVEDFYVIVGALRRDSSELLPNKKQKLFNSAFLINNKKIIGFQDKTLLPDYNIFFDPRYYSTAAEQKVFPIKDKTGVSHNIGIQICEDIWVDGYKRDPGQVLADNGAEIILNLSASPYDFEKHNLRREVFRAGAIRYKRPVVYCNLVGSYDGYEGETVYDGRSMVITSEGELAYEAPSFTESVETIDISLIKKMDTPLISKISDIHSALVLGISDYFHRVGAKKAIVGVSGGVDSAVVACLAKEALGEDAVTGVIMPSKYSSNLTQSDAQILCDNLRLKSLNFSIQETFLSICKTLNIDTGEPSLVLENIQPRVRMIFLFAMANKENSLVLNTGNKTELALGYTTVYGDLSGAISVLGDVNKKLVYELARYINSDKEIIPNGIIHRPPSAELKDNQLDADGMGASPEDIAEIIDEIVYGLTLKDLEENYTNQFDRSLIQSLYRKVHVNEWKRRQAPPAIRISKLAFGVGRRIPIGWQ